MERPILFSTDMVQALLAGRKTQTRRTNSLSFVNESPETWTCEKVEKEPAFFFFNKEEEDYMVEIKCPYGKPGDLLWVRENFCFADSFENGKEVRTYSYQATPLTKLKVKWKPSIHMPKKAARIWLKVTNVRVERLHDISKRDSLAEGVFEIEKDEAYTDYMKQAGAYSGPIGSFLSLWESINGLDSVLANPWVWVIDFKVVSTTGRANVKEVQA